MKFNLEIEIDWIDEESNLDETVKSEIIAGITRKIGSNITAGIEAKVNKAIDDNIVKKVDTLVEGVFNGFMNKPITITDRYGDEIAVYDNLSSLLKYRFDSFLTKRVDKYGKETNSTYDSFSRIDFIVNNNLKNFSEKFTKESAANVKAEIERVHAEIKGNIETGIKEHLGDKIMNLLEVPKMLSDAKGQ